MQCRCGSLIRKMLGPTEGFVLRDEDQPRFYSIAARDITSFFAAVRGGTRNAWLAAYFSPEFPTDTSDEIIVYDIFAFHECKVALSITECADCGRLWVQRVPGNNEYRSYAPDEPGYAGVLRSQQNE
jgi:hypothetical protein